MQKKHVVKSIVPGSIADELGILPGQKLLTVNNNPVKDIFDYQYYAVDEFVTVEIESQDGSIDEYEIEKDYGVDLGIVFESSLMDDYMSCSNKCIFCFIDQMPPGMRKTLYFKDDDSRLSFLQGNYVTLTNMTDNDIDRIIRYRMEPINISIHTTNPELRCKMLNNRFAGDVLKYLDKLNDAGIKMNGQIVLCKGINDGKELERTINDLMKYIPNMESLSVVPVGLTKYRDGLYPLEPFSQNDAEIVLNIIENFQNKIYNNQVMHFVHASDEFYLLAGKEVPEDDRYDGYPQLENGVGMLRLLMTEFSEALRDFDYSIKGKRSVSIATGILAFNTVKNLTEKAVAELEKRGLVAGNSLNVSCFGIKNDFFGGGVTVSGLVCGRDLCNQLKGIELGEELLIPVNMLRSGEEYFLDDVTVAELEEELNVKITIVPRDGQSLLNAICGLENTDFGRQTYEQADGGCCWQT